MNWDLFCLLLILADAAGALYCAFKFARGGRRSR